MSGILDFLEYAPDWMLMTSWMLILAIYIVLLGLTLILWEICINKKHIIREQSLRRDRLNAWLKENNLDVPLANQVAGARLKPKRMKVRSQQRGTRRGSRIKGSRRRPSGYRDYRIETENLKISPQVQNHINR